MFKSESSKHPKPNSTNSVTVKFENAFMGRRFFPQSRKASRKAISPLSLATPGNALYSMLRSSHDSITYHNRFYNVVSHEP